MAQAALDPDGLTAPVPGRGTMTAMTTPAVGPAARRPAPRGTSGPSAPSTRRVKRSPATSVALAERAGGPDLARGLALLGIAMANTIGWLHGTEWTVLLKQADATVADRVVDVIASFTIDNRGFPLFAMLFGYGIGILHRRSRARGERARTFLARTARRHLVLLLLGLAHGILLFSGDILASYAIIGMLCAVLVTVRKRWLLPVAAILTTPLLAFWGWADGTIGLWGMDGYDDASAATYLEGLEIRAWDMLYVVGSSLATDLGLLGPMVIGALAARIHLFEQVQPNRDLLVPTAQWGIAVGLAGALPLTAVLVFDPHHDVLDNEIALGILGVIHQFSGVVGALGAAAAAALIADHVRRSNGPPGTPGLGVPARAVYAVEALGAMALTAYVAQSAVFMALFPPYTLDLGARVGSAGAAVIVLVSWLAMVAIAVLLRRAGRRGPLEVVLRKLGGSTSPRRGGPARTGTAPTDPTPGPRRPGRGSTP